MTEDQRKARCKQLEFEMKTLQTQKAFYDEACKSADKMAKDGAKAAGTFCRAD